MKDYSLLFNINRSYDVASNREIKQTIACKTDDSVFLPKRAHASDAGADLVSSETVDIYPGEQRMIDCGVSVKIPPGYAGFVFNRSSQGKLGITIPHSVGVIDSDYRGNIKVILKNCGDQPYKVVAKETKIAQLVVVPVLLAEFVDIWNDTERGTGGFGSTGANVKKMNDKLALSDITVFNKYARFNHQANRRENWQEIVTRNMLMHIEKYPNMEADIRQVYERFVYTKRVLPSMRSLQFGGRPILMAENRIFNCAYAPVENVKFFSELMFLLLGGTGMGYSVQKRHISKLPKVKTPESDGEYKYQVQDSIVGWSDAVKVVCKAFFNAGTLPVFDYRDIREKGAELITTGGLAPGPEPLKICIENLIEILRQAVGRHIKPIEAHDMACVIADAVLAGGIRRAAMISLFDRDDEEMLACKAGEWYITHPARARANNSAVLPRGEVSESEFRALMQKVEASGCGEPGVYWTNNKDWGTNPCCEIALRPYQMCNLTEINAGAIHTQREYNEAASAAAFIGTLQAGYTDFHYLNPKWRIACEKDALLGVSMTGIASGTVEKLDMEWAAACVIETNQAVAKKIGINPAARTNCVKPAGTTSLVLGTSSGIHAWHAPYYIRRMRAGKNEALAQYMMKAAPELVEQDVFVPNQVLLSFPQKAPEGAAVRSESMYSLLERVKNVSSKWVKTGHIDGVNQHNVSCTISVKDDEWAGLTDWMWQNRDSYNGISVLPYFGAAAYPQLPFEDITEEKYLELLPYLENIDIGRVFENDGTEINLAGELACAGGACEI